MAHTWPARWRRSTWPNKNNNMELSGHTGRWRICGLRSRRAILNKHAELKILGAHDKGTWSGEVVAQRSTPGTPSLTLSTLQVKAGTDYFKPLYGYGISWSNATNCTPNWCVSLGLKGTCVEFGNSGLLTDTIYYGEYLGIMEILALHLSPEALAFVNQA
jgi:hypothetical protein